MPFPLCINPTDHDDSVAGKDPKLWYHWSRNSWRQGPRLFKNVNVTIDIEQFTETLQKAIAYIKETKFKGSSNFVVEEFCGSSSKNYESQNMISGNKWETPLESFVTSLEQTKHGDVSKLEIMGDIGLNENHFQYL